MAVNSQKVICGKVIKAIIKVMELEEEVKENCTDYRQDIFIYETATFPF